MRIGGEAPGRQAQSTKNGTKSMEVHESPPPRIVIGRFVA